MADERDPKVSQRYRELKGEEPPRELDQTILSAARRAVDKPHAPLVTPSGRHRWYFSLGAAAVIVLAVAVTYHMQQEVPDPDSVAVAPAPAAKPETAERAEEPAREPAVPPRVFVPDPKPQAQESPREPARQAPGARSDVAGAAAPRAETPAPAESAGERKAASPETQARREAAPSSATPMQAPAVEAPQRMLERIVELRKEGKHGEADRLFAEFKRRYPDYRLSDAMLEKVEKK